MKFLRVLFILFFPSSVFGQNKTTDSLFALLKTAKEDTNKVIILDHICNDTELSTEKILEFARQELILSKKLSYREGQAWSYSTFGKVYFKLSSFDLAIENYLKCIKVCEQLNNIPFIATCNNNIGNVLGANNEYKKATEYYLKALQTYSTLGFKKEMGQISNNLGVAYKEMGDYNKSLEFYLSALDIWTALDDKFYLGMTYENLGVLSYVMKKNDLSLTYFKKALNAEFEVEDEYGTASTKINLGLLYNQLKDHKNALSCLDTGLSVVSKLGDKNLMLIAYRGLSEAYTGLNRHKDATLILTKYLNLKDSVFNEEKAKQISELTTKYATEKKEKENLILTNEVQTKELQLSKSRYLMFALVVLLLMSLAIGFLFLKQNRLKSEQKALQLEQKLLRLQMNPHFIFNSLIAIESFIHTKQPDEAREYLADFAKLMRLILENSREEYVSLQKEIDTLNYYLRLQKLTLEDRFTYNVNLDKDLDTEEIQLPPMLIQPFIENAIKHGVKDIANGHVEIAITKEKENLIIEIKDNGKGIFEGKEKSSHTSLATTITKERLTNINHRKKSRITFDIQSLPSKGTRVIFNFPIR